MQYMSATVAQMFMFIRIVLLKNMTNINITPQIVLSH